MGDEQEWATRANCNLQIADIVTPSRSPFDSSRVARLVSRPLGYTVIELVVVIVILGIVAAIAGPKFFGTNVFNERGYADEVASAMRYSQKIAVASGCSVRLLITSSGYNAMQQAASGNKCNASSSSWTVPVLRIDGSTLAGTPPNNANVSSPATVVFNSQGAVTSGATNLTIGAYTLALDATSGFVEVR